MRSGSIILLADTQDLSSGRSPPSPQNIDGPCLVDELPGVSSQCIQTGGVAGSGGRDQWAFLDWLETTDVEGGLHLHGPG